MNKQELIEALADFPDDTEVVLWRWIENDRETGGFDFGLHRTLQHPDDRNVFRLAIVPGSRRSSITEETQEEDPKPKKKITAYQQAQKIASYLKKNFASDDPGYGPQAWTANRAEQSGYGTCPLVVWEGGPYDWVTELKENYEKVLDKDRFFVEFWNSFIISIVEDEPYEPLI